MKKTSLLWSTLWHRVKGIHFVLFAESRIRFSDNERWKRFMVFHRCLNWCKSMIQKHLHRKRSYYSKPILKFLAFQTVLNDIKWYAGKVCMEPSWGAHPKGCMWARLSKVKAYVIPDIIRKYILNIYIFYFDSTRLFLERWISHPQKRILSHDCFVTCQTEVRKCSRRFFK